MSKPQALRLFGWGVGLGALLAACAPTPPIGILPDRLQTTADMPHDPAGRRRPELKAKETPERGKLRQTFETGPGIQIIQNLTDAEIAAADQAIRKRLEQSSPDHYPKVEELQLLPGLQEGSVIFNGHVQVAGFRSYGYDMIGHYDTATGTITFFQQKRDKW